MNKTQIMSAVELEHRIYNHSVKTVNIYATIVNEKNTVEIHKSNKSNMSNFRKLEPKELKESIRDIHSARDNVRLRNSNPEKRD